MLEIDTRQIKDELNKLSTLIGKYEETKLNLFYNLNNSCVDWQDNNSLKFNDKIYIEKQETEQLIEHLKSKKNIYTYIYNQYSQIGNKIKYDATNNTNMINKINGFIDACDVIINQFGLIANQTECKEHNNIVNEKNRMSNLKTNLLNIRIKYQDTQKKINEIELSVKNSIDRLEMLKISDFELNS